MSDIKRITLGLAVSICMMLPGQSLINFNAFNTHLNEFKITQYDDIEDNTEKQSHNPGENGEKHEHSPVHSEVNSEEIDIVNLTIVDLKNLEMETPQGFYEKLLMPGSHLFKIFRPPKA